MQIFFHDLSEDDLTLSSFPVNGRRSLQKQLRNGFESQLLPNFWVFCSWRLNAYSVNTCVIVRLCCLFVLCICISSAPRKKKNLCRKLGTISWRCACYLRRALLYVLVAQAFALLKRNALILPWIPLLTKNGLLDCCCVLFRFCFLFLQSHCSNNNAAGITEVIFFIIWIEKPLLATKHNEHIDRVSMQAFWRICSSFKVWVAFRVAKELCDKGSSFNNFP